MFRCGTLIDVAQDHARHHPHATASSILGSFSSSTALRKVRLRKEGRSSTDLAFAFNTHAGAPRSLRFC
jgi:hypothetical protein